MIPNIVHFVFGLREQDEPFHPLHYAAIESCRRVVAPEQIHFHYKHLPYGPYWDEIVGALTLHRVELVPEVTDADYSAGHVPAPLRYAHHADFLRLDILIEHGGIYADIDTVFVRPFPQALFEQPFVIGREGTVVDEVDHTERPSLCNALLMAEPGSAFARTWRSEMARALNGTWSNHSGFLSHSLAVRMPEAVHVVPEEVFFPFPADPAGLSRLLREEHPLPEEALSVHLWAHLWWDRPRVDMSLAQEGWYVPDGLGHARTTLAGLVRPYLLASRAAAGTGPGGPADSVGPAWRYLSLDEYSGYATAADRCRLALRASGLSVDWLPFVPGRSWGLGYEPAFGVQAAPSAPSDDVVVAHLVPEYFPLVRRLFAEEFLVGHTVWETDRLPAHWAENLDVADLLVVPSQFSAQVIENAGVRPPVAVVPYVALDPEAVGDERWLDVDDDVFVFYSIAEWNERKAPFKTLEAYLRAFSAADPVLMILKTSIRDNRFPSEAARGFGPGTTAFAVARQLAGHPDPPALRLITRTLNEREVVGLHRRGDCFVSLCRGEGWGIGAFDAAACGTPVITTGFGGHLDYLERSALLVDHVLVPVDDRRGGHSYTPDQRWAEPDVEHAVELCRQVARHPEATRAEVAAIADQVQERYAAPVVARLFRSAVEMHRPARTDRAAP